MTEHEFETAYRGARETGAGGRDEADVSSFAREEGLLLRAAVVAGAMESALACAVDHASTREQFGAPLRSFQAVQGLLASLAAEFFLVDAAVAAAAARHGRSGFAAAAVSASTQASLSAGPAAALAHQIVGAVGFTEQHELGRFTGVMLRVRDEHGGEFARGRELGELLLDKPDGLWRGMVDTLGWETCTGAECAP